MTLSDISIKRPVFAWMLMTALIVFGWIGFERMGISLMPDVDFPVLTVTITLEGAAPEVMESQVADVIEDAVMSIQGVREVSSVSRQGNTTVTVEFDLDRDIDIALQEVQTKIAQSQKQLPREIDPPVVTKTNPEDQPIMWIALSGDRPLKDLMSYTKDYLKDQFTTVAGVGDIFLGGYIDPNLRVGLDAQKMSARELTVDDIINAIQQQHAETPAGYIDTGTHELNVRVMGEAATPEEFGQMTIPTRSGGGPIWTTFRIKDIATVEDGLNDIRRISRTWGRPAVGIGIRKQRGANAVAVAQAVKKKLAQVSKGLPQGMNLRVVNDMTRFIEESTHELNFTLVLSALLTGVVCWFFLGSWSSTLNVLLAIPTSIIGSFIILYFMGFTLNTFTLLGLSLAIGIVVDDAIMVLENIVRYNEEGLTRVKAALVGAREITFAALAASVAILAIFVPVVFMKGIIGKFFFQFGVTMSVAVMLSLLEALTLAPMRCSQFLDSGRNSWIGRRMEALLDRVTESYRRTLGIALAHRWKVVLASIGIFASSIFLARFIKKEFVPPQDQGMMLVRVQTPLGSSIEFTDRTMKAAEAWAMRQPNIKDYYAAVGGFGGGEVNIAIFFITLKDRKDRVVQPELGHVPTQQELQPIIRQSLAKIPGMMRVVVQDLSLSGFTAQRGFPIEFTIRGPDWDQLAAHGEDIMKRMADSGLMTDVDTDYQLGMPEIRVLPDRTKAGARGVSVASIGNSINAMIGGVRVGKFTRAGKRYDIRLRLVEPDRSSPQDISKIWVRNNRGEVIPMSQVVRINEKPTLLSISRRNRERAIGIFANVAPGHSQAEAIDAVEKIGKHVLPDGYRLVLSGSAQTFKESFQSLLFALVLGFFVAYMVLAAQFNSFIHPVAVLLALPFSVTGALLALLIGGRSLNMYSMIGILLLMGIVKKNSILLVDFTNERRRHGMGLREALLEACPIRLRPILMTSVATVAAAIPPALGIGPGAETRIPMALVVIGGVSLSTLLTLYVVPCAYSLFARLESHKHDEDLKATLTELGELAPSR